MIKLKDEKLEMAMSCIRRLSKKYYWHVEHVNSYLQTIQQALEELERLRDLTQAQKEYITCLTNKCDEIN